MWTNPPVIIGALALSIASGPVLAGATGAQLTADERQQIASIPERYVQNALAGDWDAVADLYHRDAIQGLPDTGLVEGRDAIRAALSGLLGPDGGVELTDFSVDLHESEVLGETIYVRASYRFELEPIGDAAGTVEQHGPYFNILRQDADGDWRIWRQFVGRAHPPSGPAAE